VLLSLEAHLQSGLVEEDCRIPPKLHVEFAAQAVGSDKAFNGLPVEEMVAVAEVKPECASTGIGQELIIVHELDVCEGTADKVGQVLESCAFHRRAVAA
jgi:hypothetical protein